MKNLYWSNFSYFFNYNPQMQVYMKTEYYFKYSNRCIFLCVIEVFISKKVVRIISFATNEQFLFINTIFIRITLKEINKFCILFIFVIIPPLAHLFYCPNLWQLLTNGRNGIIWKFIFIYFQCRKYCHFIFSGSMFSIYYFSSFWSGSIESSEQSVDGSLTNGYAVELWSVGGYASISSVSGS